MTWIVPVELEHAIYGAARAALGDAPLASPALTAAIIDRSARYTSERDELARPRDRTGDLAARAVFFTIADAMKIAIPLRELASRGALPAGRPLRFVDLGAGCGAMTLGLLATLDLALDVVAIDQDAPALAIAKPAITDFAARRGVALSITTRTGDATKLELPRADLIVMGTLLNELPHDAALAVVERALAAIGDDGAVIVIEPALRETSRALHAIRDAVITRETGHVFAPCTRRAAPCPALTDPRDWCHEDRALQLPPNTASLARLTHLRDSGMKFAYLVLRKTPLDLVAAGDSAWRVVSAPMPAKGKLEVIGCSAHGRIPLRLLKRNRDARNRDFERADRGDVLIVDAAPADDRVELRADHTVTRVEPGRK
jgi:ribosomal protein RSM22 (predicted rRNA methylase)